MTTLFNPLIPGFHPDPSVVEVDGAGRSPHPWVR